MDNSLVLTLGIALATMFGFLAFFALMVWKLYHKSSPGLALIRTGGGRSLVGSAARGGIIAIPIVHHVSQIDVTLKRLMIQLNDRQGLLCRDGTRVDCEADFHLRIGEHSRDIREVAEVYGCQRATNLEALHELFDFKFTAALRCSAVKFDAKGLLAEVDNFKSAVLDSIGQDLNGFQLDEIEITFPGLR